MSKKNILLFAFFMAVYSPNVIAVPSIRQLGNNTSVVAKKANITPAKQTERKPSTAVMAKTATVPAIKVTGKTDNGRFPAITIGKSIHSVKLPTPTPSTTQNTQPVNAGVSEQELNAVVNRIEALEEQNTNVITDVVESDSGNYVTDIAVDGNKLNVTKTPLLYAPVRNENSDTITSNAEIWIVK